MKILITGMTARHCGSTKTKLDYAQATTALRNLLNESHEIRHRKIEFGEDLSEFDLILFGVHKIGTQSAQPRNTLGLAWAAREYLDKMVPFYDDWSAMHTIGGAQTLLRTWENRMAFYQGGKPWSEDEEAAFRSFTERLAEGYKWSKALIPAFPWANSDELVARFPRASATLLWDPTRFSNVFVDEDPDYVPITRERRWVLATLQDHSGWVKKQKFAWPVEQYGVNSLKQPVFDEFQVRRQYRKFRGVLAPQYPAPGWWRARFYHAAVAGAVLYSDREDSKLMHPSFQHSLEFLESTTDYMLDVVANSQNEWIESQTRSAYYTKTKVNDFLESYQ